MTTRPIVLLCVQFVTALAINSAFGTITDARSKVSISVERTLMRLTMPSPDDVTIQSPTLIGRSKSKISPETKLLTMLCRPKPMPTESAPAIIAKFERLKPRMLIAAIKPTTSPK